MILKVVIPNGENESIRNVYINNNYNFLVIETINLEEELKILDYDEMVEAVNKKVKGYFIDDVEVMFNVVKTGKQCYVVSPEDDSKACIVTDGEMYLMNDEGKTIERIN